MDTGNLKNFKDVQKLRRQAKQSMKLKVTVFIRKCKEEPIREYHNSNEKYTGRNPVQIK